MPSKPIQVLVFAVAALLSWWPLSSQATGRDLADCAARFETYRQDKVAQGVPDKHLPAFHPALGGGDGSKATVILIHGLFESPYFLRGMAAEFQRAGHDVLSVLLPGQWEADPGAPDRVRYQDWLDELEQAVAVAGCGGAPIIFAGHSLGGTLALVGALRYAAQTAGLALWAPALQLRPLPALGGVVGSLLRVDGNLFTGRQPDRDEAARYAPNLALQAYGLLQWAVATFGDAGSSIEELRRSEPASLYHSGAYRKIAVPTFLVIADNDPAVSPAEERRLFAELMVRKAVIEYTAAGPVWHGNLLKSHMDTYRIAPDDFNPSFEGMARDVTAFFSAS